MQQRHQFNSFWHGDQLSPVEWVCLSSFIEHGHKLRLFSYDPITVPHGVSVADATEITTRDELFQFGGSFAAFSDLFRYNLISKYGEWWVDTDVYCLNDDIPECRYAWAYQDMNHINGAVLKFPRNDPTLNNLNRAAREIGRNVSFWGEVGPCLLTKHLMASRFDDHFGKREEFYPIHWLETFLFWLPDCNHIVLDRCREACFVHLWAYMFSLMGIDRYAKPPSGSFLEKIYAPHTDRFKLYELRPEQYNHTLESIKEFCNSVSCSEKLVGHNISKFPFHEYIKPTKIPTQSDKGFQDKVSL